MKEGQREPQNLRWPWPAPLVSLKRFDLRFHLILILLFLDSLRATHLEGY